MRLQVLIDESNEILGIIRPTEQEPQDAPISVRLIPQRGQRFIQVEVPDELKNARTAHELHLFVRRFLPE